MLSKVLVCRSQSQASVSEHGSRIPAGRRWQEHQFGQFAWPAAQPGCEFGLRLCRGPCGGGSGLTPGEVPSPSAPISLSAHGWILAPVHVSLPLQPPLQYLSILLVRHYANIEISPLHDYGDSDITDFLTSCAFSADSISPQVYFSVS